MDSLSEGVVFCRGSPQPWVRGPSWPISLLLINRHHHHHLQSVIVLYVAEHLEARISTLICSGIFVPILEKSLLLVLFVPIEQLKKWIWKATLSHSMAVRNGMKVMYKRRMSLMICKILTWCGRSTDVILERLLFIIASSVSGLSPKVIQTRPPH